MEIIVAKKDALTPLKRESKQVDTQGPNLQSKNRIRYRRMFERIIKELQRYWKNPDIKFLQKAYKFAYEAHENHYRKSGAPYIEHCLETALILTQLRMDVEALAAGFLHDAVEDAEISIEEITDHFGEEVGRLVDGVTKISELKFQSQAEKQAENF